jgi:WD40 repeat protein
MAARPSDSTRFDGERDTVRAFREDLSQASGASAASLEGSGTMSNGWTPKVADFGLARTTDTQDLTLTGELLGTPKYMSPEQARGERGGPPCDIYALGCILYRLLAGRTPFHGATSVETLRRVVEDVPVSPRVLQPGLSVDLTTICLKCLEKDPQQRYASARDLADDLSRFLSGDLIHARPASSFERFVKWSRRHPAVASLSFALLAVAVTGFALVFWQWRKAVNLADRNLDLVAERSLGDAVRLADQKMKLAGKEKAAREEADKLRGLAERQLGLANTARLAAQSNSVRAKNPVLSLLLALESAKAARAKGEPVQPETFDALIGSVAGVGGSPLTGHTEPIACVAFSADSRWLATTSWDDTIRVWDLSLDTPGNSPIVLTGHSEEVNAAAFTPDGRWLITGSNDNTARVWDLSDRESIQCLLVLSHPGDVSKIDITTDGRWLAMGGQGVALFDLNSTNIEESRRALNGPRGKIHGLRFTPDSKRLLAAGDEGKAFVWGVSDSAATEPSHSLPMPGACRDLEVNFDGTRFGVACGAQGVVWKLDNLAAPPVVLRGHTGVVTALRFSPDGHSVLTSGGDSVGRLWDLNSIDPSGTAIVLRGHDHYAAGADISPDGRWAATVAADAQVRLWDLTTGKREPTSLLLPGHRGFIDHAKFSPDGRWLVTGGWDQITRVWDMSKNLPTHSPVILRGPNDVTSADLSADDRWLAVGYGTGILVVWDLEAPGEPPTKFREHTRRILNTKISGDGRWVVTGGEDFTARLLDRNSNRPPELFAEGLTRLGSVAISKDGHWVAAGRRDGTVLLRDLSESGTDRTLTGLSGPAISLAFNADNRLLAMGCRDGSVAILDLSKADATLQFSPHHHDGMVSNLRFIREDRLASFGGREAMLWEFGSKTQPRIFRGDGSFATTAASLSGRWLAAGGWDTHVRLWDRESKSESPFILEGHSGAIDGCVISADDRWLVTSSRDETVMMWDLTDAGQSGSPVVLHGHSGTIRVAMFTHSGDRLITGGNGDSIRIWYLGIDSLMNAARRVAGRELSPQERRRYLKSAKTDAGK